MDKKPELDVETFIEALDAINDGIAIFDADARPLYTNAATKRRFGLHHKDLEAGLSYAESTKRAVRRGLPEASEEEIQKVADQLCENFHTGQTYSVWTDDDRLAQVTFREMSGGLKAAISVDVTDLHMREKELKKAYKAAEAASASKSTFLANISHEVRTPLNGVLGMAQVIERSELTDEQREWVRSIIESGQTLTALLNDVLDLSKIEAGKFDITPSDTDVAHVLRRVLNLWRPRAEEKGLELSLTLDSEIPPVLSIDSVRMQQCVSNLISNAIKFTAEGRVDVHAKARPHDEDGWLVEIQVTDTGPGMDAETLGRLFQPFTQADETVQRAHGGTGLGLSITRQLAELMGGQARAQSEPGRGSTFVVSFAAKTGVTAPRRRRTDPDDAPNPDRANRTLRGLRVLLVDDHPINRQVVQHFLSSFELEIVEAANGREALDHLRAQPFDIVLLDIHMPVMDGPTTIAEIRNGGHDFADVPVVALTADAMSGDRERYLGMGMNGYLAKPLAERELVTEIIRVLGEDARDEPAAAAG
ncbi:MAG: ATP-binding protein [Maricaulaceae bacterium]